MSIKARLARLDKEYRRQHPDGPLTQAELNLVPDELLEAVCDVHTRIQATVGGRELRPDEWDRVPSALEEELKAALRKVNAVIGR